MLIGSEAEFGGRDVYFGTHGHYEIKDYNDAIDEKIIKNNHYEFWGMEDSYLFKWAKKELKKLSKSNQPFNLTLLTVNTHFPDGYLEDDCEIVIEGNQYANVLACSSKQVGEFIKWVQQQDFYENTTIIINGDHLSMAGNSLYDGIDFYDRQIYNVIINSPITTSNNKNRKYTSMDLFPTTMAALGASIDGDKLGLGINLFSDKKTIVEENDFSFVNIELTKKSDFYYNNLLYN